MYKLVQQYAVNNPANIKYIDSEYSGDNKQELINRYLNHIVRIGYHWELHPKDEYYIYEKIHHSLTGKITVRFSHYVKAVEITNDLP